MSIPGVSGSDNIQPPETPQATLLSSLCTKIMQATNPCLCCGMLFRSPRITSVSKDRIPLPSGQKFGLTQPQTMAKDASAGIQPAATREAAAQQSAIRCVGMSNYDENGHCLNKCYFNAVIKSLWATPGMHDLVNRKAHENPPNEMAQHLQSLFTALSSSKTTISHTHPDVVAILTLVNNDQFHALENRQQDAQELLLAIYSHLLFTPEAGIPPEEIDIARMFSMNGLYTIDEVPSRPPSPAGINLYIPNIDHGEHSNQRCFTAHIPEGTPSWCLDRMFGPYTKTENMDEYQNIRRTERNNSLTDEQIRAEMERLGNEVHGETRFEFSGTPPQFFPVQLARFSTPQTKEEAIRAIHDEARKSDSEILQQIKNNIKKENQTTPQPRRIPNTLEEASLSDLVTVSGSQKKTEVVFPPLVLNAPCKEKPEPIPYHLQSIVVQMGKSTGSGHYYTYIPDRSSPPITLPAYNPGDPNDPFRGKEFPSRWIKHEDNNVSEVSSHTVVADIARNGYLFMYEKAP